MWGVIPCPSRFLYCLLFLDMRYFYHTTFSTIWNIHMCSLFGRLHNVFSKCHTYYTFKLARHSGWIAYLFSAPSS